MSESIQGPKKKKPVSAITDSATKLEVLLLLTMQKYLFLYAFFNCAVFRKEVPIRNLGRLGLKFKLFG